MATSFKAMTAEEPNTILIVDSLNLAFRWKHKKATEFVNEYIRTIESLKKSYKASKVIITCDEGSSSYRKNIFPEYKANREALRANQTAEEAAYFEAFFQEFNRVIDTYKEVGDYPVFKFYKVEADDISAYIVGKRRKKNKIWLASSDKDWDLLVCDTVSRFSYVTRKEVTLDNWNEHYDYSPDDHISIKCLMGDGGDNIPGVDGIGPKTAVKLIQQYGDAYEIAASLPIASKYKYVANLNTFGVDRIIRNYNLMDLVTHCADAIGADNCAIIDKQLEEYLGT
jgi:5'-3' exonuclease